ncbi:MAG: ACP S-malonyltransferase, partial [Candidatus Omnitrophica bacterium]|nr:ACP S-malonyltransferase [Candidatus Omnitrophota bacterium]
MLKIALLFPGQGAQYVGMGKPLYDRFPIAKKTFEEADQVLGWSLTKLCFEGPQEELTQTANSQPAILTASVAAWRVFKEKFIDQVGAGLKPAPTAAAGLSLGEYSALVAAEAISFSDALRIVRIRGEEMEKAARQNPGTMASIIGLEKGIVEEICRESGAEVANINSPEQIVISGTKESVEKGASLAKSKGAKRAILLDVSGAFHSKWMAPAQAGLKEALERVSVGAHCNVPL